jgi:hypothetical protein
VGGEQIPISKWWGVRLQRFSMLHLTSFLTVETDAVGWQLQTEEILKQKLEITEMKKETKLSDVIISLVGCPSSLMSDCSVYTCSLQLTACELQQGWQHRQWEIF